jgi:O-antigen/teichoic acid export membrane protein
LIGYGGHMSGSNLAQLAMLNIDYLIVSRVLGATSLGEYSIAFRLAYLPYLNIAVVIGGASFPYLCRLRGEKLGLSTERIAGLTITAVVPLCAGIALLAEQLELLGRQWAPAVPVVRWLMVYTVILSAGQLVQVALNSSGRPRTTLGLRVLHLCALAVALVILTKHGITAVAIGQVVAVVLVTGVAGVLATRHLAGFHIGRLLRSLAPALVGVVTMAAIVLALRAWLPGADVSAGRLVVLGLAGLIAYAVPVWLLDRERIVQTAALLRGGR